MWSAVLINNGSNTVGSLGNPLSELKIKIVDQITGEEILDDKPGELHVTGPSLMLRYYNNEDENIFHFFGSIVYIDTLHKGSFSEWTVIDGQQRLTTIFLILQALKQIYSENEKIISKKYLLNDEDIINSNEEMDRYRLKPLVSDDNVYKLIQDNKLDKLTDEDQNSNVLKAFNVIKKELTSWKEKYSFEQILGAIDKFKIVYDNLTKLR